MATTTKTFAFLSNSESFVATPNGNTLAWQNIGNPAGSLSATRAGKNISLTTSYWEYTGTWESLGVPVGDIVTSVRLQSASNRLSTATAARTGLTIGPYEIRDSAAALIGTLWAGRTITTQEASWFAVPQQSEIAIPNHASGTTVKIRLSDSIGTANTTGATVTTHDDQVSLVITHAPPDVTAPTNPSNLSATDVFDPVLTWTASTDAVGVTKYEIERKTGVGGTYAKIGEVTGAPPATTYTDTTPATLTTYYYRVRALDAAGNPSGYSNEDPATTPGVYGVDVSWTPSTSSDVRGQYVFRRTTAGSYGAALSTELSAATTSFRDTTAVEGVAYYYKVRTYDTADLWTDSSEVLLSQSAQLSQTLAATITPTATRVARVNKGISATIANLATLLKRTDKPLPATITQTASTRKQVQTTKQVTQPSTPTMNALKIFMKALTATISSTSSITKLVGKPLSTSVTPAATLLKRISKIFSLTQGSTATINTMTTRLLYSTVSAVITPVAAIRKSVGKIVPVTNTPDAIILKSTAKRVVTTIGSTAALLKSLPKTMVASIGSTSGLLKRVGKPVQATVTMSTIIGKGVPKLVATTISVTPTLLKSTSRLLNASLSSTTSIRRSVGKLMPFTVITTPTVLKRAVMTLRASISMTTAISQLRVFLKTLSTTIGSSSLIVKQGRKIVTASSVPTATILKAYNWLMLATVGTSSNILKRTNKIVRATSSVTASMLQLRVFLKTLAATVGNAVVIRKQTGKVVTASANSAAAMTRRTIKLVQATVTMTSDILKRIAKTFRATTTPTAAMGQLRVFLKTMAATIGSTAILRKQPQKILLSSISNTTSRLVQVRKVMQQDVPVTASINKLVSLVIKVISTVNVFITSDKFIRLLLSTSVGVVADIRKTLQQLLYAEVTTEGTQTVSISKIVTASVDTLASVVKDISKTIRANSVVSAILRAFQGLPFFESVINIATKPKLVINIGIKEINLQYEISLTVKPKLGIEIRKL